MATANGFTAYALDNMWEERATMRSQEVPQPAIFLESNKSKANLKKGDVIIVRNGGLSSFEPATLGHNEESNTQFVNLDIRTVDRNRENFSDSIMSPGYTRLFGKRDVRTNTGEKYGGLIGECRRIFHELRRGSNEFNKIQITEVNDVSDQEGVNHYRAIMTIRFETIAENITVDQH